MGALDLSLMGESWCVVHGVVFPDVEHVDGRAVDHLCSDGTVMDFETAVTPLCALAASLSPLHDPLSVVCLL